MTISEVAAQIHAIHTHISKTIVGQEHLIRNMMISLLARGHLLLEWPPGLAKTLSVETLAKSIGTSFARVQCTPDLLPSDLIGTQIRQAHTSSFVTHKGPIFAHLVLVDEINRAPAKLQSALLESMAERQVTIGDERYVLDAPFVVMATMNPLEQEGTYTLPEAQLDRFLLHTQLTYPTDAEEIEILKRFGGWDHTQTDHNTLLHVEDILQMQTTIDTVVASEEVYRYIQEIVAHTRPDAEKDTELGTYTSTYIQYGASPRASLALLRCAKVIAVMNERAFVIPEDIQSVAADVLRHRLILTFDAMSDGVSADDIVVKILGEVEVVKG